ncbi:MAG: PilZ domain-containing protein [Treponema sp.]|nr:PilZ domain-containing protein [Treponema sp.]
MSTPIKRIEKDFLLKTLYDDQIPIICLKGRTQYILTVEKPPKGQIFFKVNRPIEGLKVRKKLDLMFDYRGQAIIFSVEVAAIKDDHITAPEPELLYKDLDRSFPRVSTPQDLQVQFTFLGDRYSLSYPKTGEFENETPGTLVKTLDPKDLSSLVDQMEAWIKNNASGYKLVIFKDAKPSSTEERLLAETGKAFFLPSTQGTFPADDPYPKKRIITEDIFKRYLESTGVDIDFVNNAYARFIKQKYDSGIFSDLWVPILFQEYVIGYIHIWIDMEGKLAFDYGTIDTLYQFSSVLATSLKVNGYFESGKLKNDPFEGKIIDISASGLLFAYPNSVLASTLLPDNELTTRLIAPRRVVNAKAKIVRRYKDNIQGYFGCRFLDMEPEDLRFLFEYIYGKPFTDNDAAFLSGKV